MGHRFLICRCRKLHPGRLWQDLAAVGWRLVNLGTSGALSVSLPEPIPSTRSSLVAPTNRATFRTAQKGTLLRLVRLRMVGRLTATSLPAADRAVEFADRLAGLSLSLCCLGVSVNPRRGLRPAVPAAGQGDLAAHRDLRELPLNGGSRRF